MVISPNIFFLFLLNLYNKGKEIRNEIIENIVNNITFKFKTFECSSLSTLGFIMFKFREIVLFSKYIVPLYIKFNFNLSISTE
ncbi:MAG: hypothetical protein ACFFG0_39605, partial [Candidatus Thorarchaeota archaeon]